VFDTCANWQPLKCLTIVNEFTHECLTIEVAGGIRSSRVIEVLAQLVSVHGEPRRLRSDYGTEFVSAPMDLVAEARQSRRVWRLETEHSHERKLKS
jgi:hypothetical protein